MLSGRTTKDLVAFTWQFYRIVEKLLRGANQKPPTLFELQLLARIGMAGEVGITASQLVHDIGMSKTSVSRKVLEFVEEGVLEQRPSADGRSTTIHQTAASIDRVERWAEEVRKITPVR